MIPVWEPPYYVRHETRRVGLRVELLWIVEGPVVGYHGCGHQRVGCMLLDAWWTEDAAWFPPRLRMRGDSDDPGRGGGVVSSASVALRSARDLLLTLRTDHARAAQSFAWPDVGAQFNWGIDWFDAFARGDGRPALIRAD